MSWHYFNKLSLLAFVQSALCALCFSEETGADVYYNSHIAAVFAQNNCSSPKCHGAESGAGGLKLAMFNGNPRADFTTIANAYKSRYINLKKPGDSLLLKKLSGAVAHRGAKLSEGELELLKNWIKQGARFEDPSAPKILSIASDKSEIVLQPNQSQKLKIEGLFSDKSKRDLTESCVFDYDKSLIEVSRDGLVKYADSGVSFINASTNRKFCTVRVICASPLKGTFPEEKPANPIDVYALETLKKAGVLPSEICSDSEFMRRLYLDAAGFLPKPEEVEAFLKDRSESKRAKLIEKVLDSPEFADMLAMRLSDILRIKSEFPSNLWPNAAQSYYTWLRDAIANGMPYDVMAREMLLSSGSNFKNPPVNFYRAVNVKNADNYAEAAALVFMGVRTNCIKCHAHPSESWTPEDNAKLAGFFKHLNFKKSKEWKEEILTLDLSKTREEGNSEQLNYVFGEALRCPSGVDTREAFADWLLTKENPYFSKAVVNRVWFWIFSSGLQNPADDIRPNKGLINEKILAHLEEVFKESDFDLKSVYREIFLSNTYQRSSKPNASNARDALLFSHHIPTRIEAEYLNDIISANLGVYQAFKSITPEPYAFWPEDFKAIKLHDGSVSNPFLTLFGKPGRNSSHLNDRLNQVSMQQILHLSGSANINQKLDKSQFLKSLAGSKIQNRDKIKTLYLTFLTRHPTQREYEVCLKYFESGKAPLEAIKDLTWAILNSKEFIFKM